MAKTRLKFNKNNSPVAKTRVILEYGTTVEEEKESIKSSMAYVVGTGKDSRNNGTKNNLPTEKNISDYGQAIIDCNLAGMSQTKTSQILGINLATVSKVSKAIGLKWDGRIPEYNALTRKKQNEDKKQKIKADLLLATEKFLARMLEPTYTLVASGATRIMVEEVPVIPGGEARDLSTAARNLMFVVERLEAYEREKERNETSTVDDWLRAMTGENEWNAYDNDINYKRIEK